MSKTKPTRCEFCRRETRAGTTEHHLIPSTLHSNKWFKKRYARQQMRETVDLCPDCHGAIHELIPNEKELGRHYNTREKLLAHEGIGKFVAWVMKQK
jgi:hypothetical protein